MKTTEKKPSVRRTNKKSMMTTDDIHVSGILNDLLKINNDRVEGYKKAAEETREPDLKHLFEKLESESTRLASSLTNEITKQGGTPGWDETTNSGKIYRVWMDIKATLNGKDRKGILNACEFGEDAAQSAYRSALENRDLPSDIRALIKDQQIQLKTSHDSVKKTQRRGITADNRHSDY